MGKAYSTHGEERNAYGVLVRTPGGERLLGRLDACRKIMLRRIPREYEGMAWTGSNLTQKWDQCKVVNLLFLTKLGNS